jgi:S-methylmethionine-dependent homocysteine/selenocysteine methylase
VKVVLLDGGMGQELIHRAGDRPTPLWSTTVMMEHPGLVRAVHDDYFAAGATVATTNTYAIHRDRLEGTGFEDRFAALHAQALAEATAARDAAGTGASRAASARWWRATAPTCIRPMPRPWRNTPRSRRRSARRWT